MYDNLRKAIGELIGVTADKVTDKAVDIILDACLKDFEDFRKPPDTTPYPLKYTEVDLKIPLRTQIERLNDKGNWHVVVASSDFTNVRFRAYENKESEPIRFTLPYPMGDRGYSFIAIAQIDGTIKKFTDDEYELKVKEDAKVGGESK